MHDATKQYLLAFWTLILFLQPSQGFSEPATYGFQSRIVKHSNLDLSKEQERRFREWRSQVNYFGAFVIALDGTFVSGSTQAGGMKIAQDMAMIKCSNREGKPRRRCALYASSIPRKLPSNTVNATGLSEACLRWYSMKYKRMPVRKGTFSAFAWAGFGKCSLTRNAETEDEAKVAAIKSCRKFVSRSLLRFPQTVQTEIRRRELDKCEIIHVRSNEF